MFAAKRWALLVAAIVTLTSTRALASSPSVFLTTSRGCLETGQNPVFEVGENLQVIFRIGSATQATANARLFDILPNGNIGVISFGTLATNTVYAFNARVAPPTGIEQLLLTAKTPDNNSGQRSCSFIVVPSGPTPTRTPTRTPTGGTPPNTPTVTSTPVSSLSGTIRTNRGCLETGDTATFALGESIGISFRVNSSQVSHAQVSIADIPSSGSPHIFSFGTLPTNTSFLFRGSIAPPTGNESVQLRAREYGHPTVTLDECTFVVVTSLPTRTRTPSRTRTPTRTAKPSGTPTPTATATPTL